jgi:hypothetical protein
VSSRPDVYRDDSGTWVYRASSIGGCTRSLVAARLGIPSAPPPERLQATFEEGHRQEGLIESYLESRGMPVMESQKTVRFRVDDDVLIVGHVDGFVNFPGHGKCVMEGKGLGKNYLQQYDEGGFEAMGVVGRKYKWQAAIYMHATGLPMVYVVRSKITGESRVTVMTVPPVSEEEIYFKLGQIEAFAKRDEFPPCDAGCSAWTSFYWDIHDPDEDVVEAPELEPMLDTYLKLKEALEADQEVLKQLGDELKKSIGKGKTAAGPYTATVSHRTQRRPDVKKLKAALGEEYENYTYETSSTSLTVRRRDAAGTP